MSRSLFRFVMIGVLYFGLASCASLEGPETVTQPQPLEAAKTAPAAAPGEVRESPATVGPGGKGEELFLSQTEVMPRPEPAPAAEPQKEAAEKPVQRNGQLFSLSAQDVDINTVLLAFSQEIGQNIILDPGVSKKVTVELKDVTLKEALDHLLLPLHLEWKREGEFIHVMPQTMQTRLFRLNYIISRRRGLSNLQATSGQGTASSTSLTSGSSAGGNLGALNTGTAGGSTGLGGGGGSGRTFNNLFTSEETDLWREIYCGLKQIVTRGNEIADRPDIVFGASVQGGTSSGGSGCGSGGAAAPPAATDKDKEEVPDKGSFTVNRQAGIILVKDYPEVLLQVAEFLEEVEGSAQRQVFILAKILEVNLRDEFKLGIDWAKVSPINVINDSEPGISQGFNDTFNLTKRSTGTNAAAAAGLGWFVQGATGLFYGISQLHMNVMIDALSQQGNVSVLSSPKIATLNNQRAVIKVGTEDVFYIPQTVTAGTTGTQTTTFIPSSLTIGIVLDVLPQINKNGEVMMNINTSVSEKSGERSAPDGRTSIPVLDVRESNNVVLAQSGQTIVIGGLMKSKKTKNENELPFLGRVPILGKLFQHQEDVDEKVELVIMLTPQVMAGVAIDEKLKNEEKRLQKIVMPQG